jgi:serine/threonine protein kinase/tetratricopeptide (TPR) repeat protein
MKDTPPNRVRLGVFELDLRAGVVRTGEESVCLQQQPFFVLRMLVERGGEIVTRDEIQKKLWPNDTAVDFDQGINATIRKLRQVLRDSAERPTYIETVARRGYRLMIPVEAQGPAPSGQHSSEPDETALQPKSPSASLTGKTVSHYRVLDILGGGGMGVVYRAEDLKLGRAVALKFLPEELGGDPKALERFEREARAASALDHPNICSIYEFGEHEGQPFIVMQLLEGQTLREHLASLALVRSGSDGSCPQAFPLDQLLDVGTQIAAGLQAAHEKGIIHRDIKPANIFLTKRGLVKILDFGVAKLVAEAPGGVAVEAPGFSPANADDGEMGLQPRPGLKPNLEADPDHWAEARCFHQRATAPHLTRTGAAMGTAGYMSPEQIRGEKVDARTDLFSFGLVLYEMATGQRAFSGDTAAIVHDAIVNQTPPPAHEVNAAIPPGLEQIINRAIEKDRERRYETAAEMAADLQSETGDEPGKVGNGKLRKRSRRNWLPVASLFCVAIIAGGLYWYWRSHRPPKLSERDTFVLADFANSTGDPIFDDALKQALSTQLEQSPFINVLADRKVRETLKLMNLPPSERLTEAVAREICLRTSSTALVIGSVAGLGRQYVIALRAVNCDTGDLLAQAQQPAAGKEEVLKALDIGSTTLRRKLGESLSSVQKYATPLQEATTPSLEALKFYSLGQKTWLAEGTAAALPFYKRAVEIDPGFAMAYLDMANSYGGEDERSAENAREAYRLREKVSERERYSIEGSYYLKVTGELEKGAETYELWQKTYPRNAVPYINLGFVYGTLGRCEKVLEESQEAIRLDRNNWAGFLNLALAYQCLNRLDDAEAAYKEALEVNSGSDNLVGNRYGLAFLKGDKAQMSRLVTGAMGKPGEDALLAEEADTEAWFGRLRRARELTRRAMNSTQNNDDQGTVAAYQAVAALREVAAGNRQQARTGALAALKLTQSRDVKAMATLALAQAGETIAAEKLAAELDKSFPLDTLIQKYWLPTIQASLALKRKDPTRAVELLKLASGIELGLPTQFDISLCPAFVRGQAYLTLRDGRAAAEFQKFIDHYGLVTNFPWGALARLGLARAYAREAATDPSARHKARAAYQNFLTLWKDADPDIPIYQQANAEYAKLR